MSLTIKIDNDGVLTVSVDGMVVGLVESLHLDYSGEHPVPIIHVAVRDVDRMGTAEQYHHLKREVMNYKVLLASHPLVKVANYRDTLPQGMRAVRLEE